MNAGAPGGFEAFYAAQYRLRVRQAAGKVGGKQNAEDIVQESMLDLLRMWEQAKDPEALLTTIIQRKVYKLWNGEKRRAASALSPETEETADPAAGPEVLAEQRNTIRWAAESMSPIEREIVAGRAQRDSAAAIAARTGATEQQIRHAGRRMERRMASALAEPGPVPELAAIDLAPYRNRLPLRQRQVLTLALEGMRPAVIAQVFHITPNNARVNLHHARKAMIGILAEVFPDDDAAAGMLDHLIEWTQSVRDGWAFAPRPVPNRPRGMSNRPRPPVVEYCEPGFPAVELAAG